MEEYKIIEGTSADMQKLLNQWRHEYNLKFINTCTAITDKNGIMGSYTVIVLTRTKK
jgi:hypothetical protein